jgi:two-component system, cell cycle sensor histidine kinase and response regulator CckA
MEEPLRRVLGEGVALTLSLGASACRVLADTAQLEQVVMNVAVNARDAMSGGGQLTIEARTVNVAAAGRLREKHPALPPGRYARLAVTDNGSGMSDHVRARAFDPFFTTKPTGKGTGLGLATVYGIVKQSRGHIEVSSRPGEGTRVEIYLPCPPRKTPECHVRKAPQAPRSSAAFTVLITDDEDAVLSLACRILSQNGYTTLTARGAHEALRVSEQQKGRIDLLLTDVLMPGINGKQLADRLLALRPDMKVLFMTGYAGDALEGGGAMSAALIEKPFTAESLLGCVRRVLCER